MLNQNIPFKIIANCIPVKGVNRSTICDLHRKNIKLIPNDLYNILNECEGWSIFDIKEKYNNSFDEVIDGYFDFLDSEDFIFFTESPELFPEMNFEWHAPHLINHAILDFDKESTYSIQTALQELNSILCKHVEIRFFKKTSIDEIQNLIVFLDEIESTIVSIDFILPYHDSLIELNLKPLIEGTPRLNCIKLYNSNAERIIHYCNNKKYLLYSTLEIISEKNCGIIDPSFFSINIKTFTESQNHNSCLNKKIAVDKKGNIKNCPSMENSFGNIKKVTIQDAIDHRDFKKYWNITKDQIDTCKECEFRYVCTDCRAYINNPENEFSKPLKCGYDPYTNEWNEWSDNVLKKEAKEYYGLFD